jgi:peptide-methionine (R)-S-oxide reductase
MTAIARRTGRGPYLALFAAARCAFGVAALARPVAALRATGVDRVTAERTAWTARLLGGRDLALGAGLLHALAHRQATDGWVWAGLIADAVDTTVLTTATARRELTPTAGTLAALIGAGAVAGALPVLTDPRRDRTAEP